MELLREHTDIALVLLDIMMPQMDGFDVLKVMRCYSWLDEIPVIMISAAKDTANIERAYDLGVADYMRRPFERVMVLRQVQNVLMLYAKQKRLTRLVTDQVYEKEHNSVLMISILSHVVEFRNSESGLHVLHIRTLTDLLLHQLAGKTDRYQLDESDISLISTASALHDLGKIVIPTEILNKPGRLTAEEYAMIKTHTVKGARILRDLSNTIGGGNEPLLQVAYAICRWHHERWDGGGYPDKLKGDAIPIAAQVVALADVYDALTSDRCYKPAYDHDTALRMILNGECGAFNPLLLECLNESSELLRQELQRHVLEGTRRAVPELEDALVAHRLDGRALCRIEAAASIGARDAARKLLCRVVRQEEPEHFLGALLIRQGLEPLDEGHVDLWHGIRHEESAVCCQAADDGLRGVELLGISSGAAVFQNNRLFLHL